MPRVILAATTDLNNDQRVGRAALALHNAGYEVLVVGREKAISLPLVSTPYRQIRIRVGKEKGKAMYLAFNLALFRFLSNNKAGILVANDMDTLPAVIMAKAISKAKVVFDAHEYFSEVPELVHRPITRVLWKCLERCLIPFSDAALSVSNSLADLMSQRFNKKFEVVRNMPGSSETTLPNPASPIKRIVYAGALNKGRCLEQLIKAAARFSNIEVIICGEGDLSTELRLLAASIPHSQSSIQFKGMLPPHELKAIIASCHIGFSALEDLGLSYHYSLSNKFFDYVQAGISQLAPTLPEYQTLNKEFEVAVLTNSDEESIGIALEQLITDPLLYIKLQTNCLLAKEVWTWENEKKKYINLFDNLASKAD